jgi:two-component system CheB/CheR fusion protein
MAMLAFEVMHDTGKNFAILVFGTDISDSAVDHARAGIYPEKIADDIPADRLQRFFSRADSGFRIKQQIRESCVFARHDLTSDPPFSHMDVVSCRNVFIYLNSALQQRVLPALHYSLKPGGLLVLGSAETVGNRADLFGAVDAENKIYSKKQVPSHFALEMKPPEAASRPPAQGFALPSATLVDMDTRAARILRDLYAPAGVLINDDMQVLQLHGQTGFYLDWAPAEAGMNLLRLVRESLIHPLRRAVESAFAQKQPVHEAGIQVEHQGEVRQITLTVIPLSHDARFCLVLFENETDRRAPVEAGQGATPPDLPSGDASRELGQTRDYLRKVIEQNEATTEELRAANEEARSTNEELQSTNEELRTAKEQLQSSNEELTTINDELKHRNDALNVATNDLSNILNAATIPILMVGMDLRLRRFTPAAERLLSIVSGDLGRNIIDVPLPFRIPDLTDMLIETVRTLALSQRRVQDRDGRWYNLLVRPYRTIDDRIDGVVLTFIDIDDATRALALAERAREFADGIVETVQHPLLILDSELRVTRATGMFYKMFGVRPEDTLGHVIDELGTGQWKIPELRRLLEQAMVRDTPFRDFEITHQFPHIGTRTMRLNARRTPETDGRFSVLLAIDDVTERQEAAEIRYRRLFESAKDGVIVLDSPAGLVLDVNPAFLEMSRYSRTELMNKPFQEIPPFLGSEDMRRLVPETVERGITRYESVPVRARDGREIIVEIVANGYRVKDQSLIQLNIRDVTERRRNEEELRRSNLDLQQFAFAASHDLQEPLRTVTSFLELFQRQYEGKIDAQADEYIKFITGAADRMRHLVLDLLGFSQVVRADMNRSEFSVEAALSHVLMNLQMAIESSHAKITFDPLPMVYADATQIERLLQNLVSNSLKYRSAEPLHIHLSAREAGPDWVFSVKDNGIGIDPKYSDYIFTVFKRLHGPEYPGTGIGLAVCKRIVARHGGRIWFESEPGKGSTFFFTLPKRMKRS